mgnify:CR=1 FL=1
MNFYLNNTLINPPRNWREVGVEVNFSDQEYHPQQITITDFEFVRENIDIIKNWTNIFEGLPFRIETIVPSTGATIILFDGYLDLSDGAKWSEYGITAKAKAKHSIDWLNDVADAFTWDYLHAQGILVDSDFTAVPYVISSIPDYNKIFTSIVSLALIANAIEKTAKDIIGEFSVVSIDPFEYGLILKLVIDIIEFIALIIGAILLLKEIFEVSIQRVKYAKGIKVKRLFEIGCSHLGLNFHSSIITGDYANMLILPKRFTVDPPQQSTFGILGAYNTGEITQIGYPDGTFGDLIRRMKEMFNAKIIIDGNDFYLERRDFYLTTPQYTIPAIDINDEYQLNSNESTANYIVEFQTDTSESNTITEYAGTIFQQTLNPVAIQDPFNRTLKGITEINIDYALGKRKDGLSALENVFADGLTVIDAIVGTAVWGINLLIDGLDVLIDVINNVIDFIDAAASFFGYSFDLGTVPSINKIVYTPLENLITNRIGVLKLQHDYYVKDKIIIIDDNAHLNFPLNNVLLSAKYLFNTFHIINTFAPVQNNPNYNQYKLINYTKIPMTIEDYLKLKNNALAYDSNGNTCRVESVRYDVWNGVADLKIRSPYVFVNNLITTYYEYDGK